MRRLPFLLSPFLVLLGSSSTDAQVFTDNPDPVQPGVGPTVAGELAPEEEPVTQGDHYRRRRAEDDEGLLVELVSVDQAREGDRVFPAPLSPGLLRPVAVRSVTRIPFGVAVPMVGPGVLALDGDRDHKLLEGHALNVEIQRDGPRLIDLAAAMRWAVAQGMIRARSGQGNT